MTLKPPRRSGIPVISPLDELTVFSESEEEEEYFKKVNDKLPKRLSKPKFNHKGIQCDMNKVVELQDILKLLSCCRYENATQNDVKKLLNFSNLVKQAYCTKKSELLPKVDIENVGCSQGNQTKAAVSTSAASYCKSAEKHQNLRKKDNKGSKTNIKKGLKRKFKESQVENEHKQKSLSLVLKRKRNEVAEDNNPKQKKNILNKNIVINISPFGNRDKRHGTETEENQKQGEEATSKKQMTGEIISDEKNKNVTSTMPLTRSKLVIGEKTNQTNDANLKQVETESLKLLQKSKSLAPNRINGRHSCSYTLKNHEKSPPHFASFQSHLKMRTLHSPSEWLNSEEFKMSI